MDPSIKSLSLPPQEKIRLGMRRYAEAEVAARGICPKGFTGPRVVFRGNRALVHGYFVIECS
jgi:hypothetical protein